MERPQRCVVRRRVGAVVLLAALTSLPLPPAHAESRDEDPVVNLLPRYDAPASNDYLERGLLQVPSARTGNSGDAIIGSSFVYPYIIFGTSISAFPWLDLSLRYAKVQNHLYGPVSFSGNQTYLDRAVGFKLRLLDETADHPAVAVGIRDIIGSGLFGAEYISLSRRWYDLDMTAGVGWGELGSKNEFTNPLSLIGKFKNRTRYSQSAGTFGYVPFSGPKVSMFGGVEWHTPWQNVSLLAELDGNDYHDQPFDYDPHAKLPINVGLHWHPEEGVDIGGGFERGNALMGRIAFEFNIDHAVGAEEPDPDIRPVPKPVIRRPVDIAAPGTTDPLDKPITAIAASATASPDLPLVDRLQPFAASQGLNIIAATDVGAERRIEVRQTTVIEPADQATEEEALGQFARHAATLGPKHIDRIVLTVQRPKSGKSSQISVSTDRLEQSVALTGFTAGAIHSGTTREARFDSAAMDRVLTHDVAEAIFADLRAIDFRGEKFGIEGNTATLVFSQNRERYLPAALAPAARIVASRVPPNIQTITLVPVQSGLKLASISMQRSDIEALAARRISPEELWTRTELSDGYGTGQSRGLTNWKEFPNLSWSLLPHTQQQIGGPNGFLLFEIYANLSGTIQAAPGLYFSGALGADLWDNFDKLKLASDSVLPHVRSDIAQYLKQGKYGISYLEADYFINIASGLYGRVSGGLLEQMFSGVDTELLWRPYTKPYAFGIDVAAVQQRGFQELFDTRPYRTVTGLASFYYQLPFWNMTSRLSVGKYLARDVGATIDLSREFESGVKIGAFATKTNVSAAQFGEGSFDKGVYISIPIDMLFQHPSQSRANFLLRPLTRDGGQTLQVNKPLYDQTGGGSPEELWHQWPRLLDR